MKNILTFLSRLEYHLQFVDEHTKYLTFVKSQKTLFLYKESNIYYLFDNDLKNYSETEFIEKYPISKQNLRQSFNNFDEVVLTETTVSEVANHMISVYPTQIDFISDHTIKQHIFNSSTQDYYKILLYSNGKINNTLEFNFDYSSPNKTLNKLSGINLFGSQINELSDNLVLILDPKDLLSVCNFLKIDHSNNNFGLISILDYYDSNFINEIALLFKTIEISIVCNEFKGYDLLRLVEIQSSTNEIRLHLISFSDTVKIQLSFADFYTVPDCFQVVADLNNKYFEMSKTDEKPPFNIKILNKLYYITFESNLELISILISTIYTHNSVKIIPTYTLK